MPKVTLRQGVYVRTVKYNIHVYHGIPYARPFTKRFEAPQPLPESNEEFSITALASNCPQLPSRFAFLNGNWHPSTKYDEEASGVLSVYAPEKAFSSGPLPVIVWVHGGAWVTGGSQLSNYDGTKLAQNAGAIIGCIAIGSALSVFCTTNIVLWTTDQIFLHRETGLTDDDGKPSMLTDVHASLRESRYCWWQRWF